MKKAKSAHKVRVAKSNVKGNKPGNASASKCQARNQKKGGKKKNRGTQPRPVSQNQLDAEMESYWEKSANPEILTKIAADKEARGKERVQKRQESLDKDMDAYWAAKKAKEEAANGGSAENTNEAANSILN